MDNKNWIKVYVIDVLPIITISLYILAVLYNIAYYTVFGINIVKYISLSEMLMTIIEPLVIFLLYILFMIWMSYVQAIIILPFIKKKYLQFVARARKKTFFRKIIYFIIKLKRKVYRTPWLISRIERVKEDMDVNTGKSKLGLVKDVILSIFLSTILYLIITLSSKSVMGLWFSILIILLPPTFLINIFNKSFFSPKHKERLKALSATEVSLSLFAYYIFCICVFYHNGTDCAGYYKNNNQVTFEIKTNDGNFFSDEEYGYIDQLNNTIFLYEKETNRATILHISTLNYIKIDLSSRHNGLIPYIYYLISKTYYMSQKCLKTSNQSNKKGTGDVLIDYIYKKFE